MSEDRILSKEKENSIMGMEDCLTTEEGKNAVRKRFRTKARAGNVTNALPDMISLITDKEFRYGISFYQKGKAYLLPLKTERDADETIEAYRNGKSLKERELRRKERICKEPDAAIDLPFLRLLYSVFYQEFENNQNKINQKDITIYVPDLAKLEGKGRNISKNDIQTIIKKFKSLKKVIGIIRNSEEDTENGKAYPVMVWKEYNAEKNTICFESPYIETLITEIHKASVEKQSKAKPSHSYLIKTSITKEKNKRAVEIVCIVVATIEQAGKNVPNLKVRTIVDRIPQLRDAIAKCSTVSNKNRLLQNAFKKAWDLLERQTNLREKYPNIVLPSEIPTIKPKSMDFVLKFPHKKRSEK